MCFLEIVKISDIFFGRRARFRPEYAPIPDPVFRQPRRPGKNGKNADGFAAVRNARRTRGLPARVRRHSQPPPPREAVRFRLQEKKDGLNKKTAYAKFFYMISLVFFSCFPFHLTTTLSTPDIEAADFTIQKTGGFHQRSHSFFHDRHTSAGKQKNFVQRSKLTNGFSHFSCFYPYAFSLLFPIHYHSRSHHIRNLLPMSRRVAHA